jgi:tetraacyldisaccharide 4'-kinase
MTSRGPQAGSTGTTSRYVQRAWLTRGPLALCLLPLSWLYGAITAISRISYRRGWLASEQLDVPVIVVGNLVAGGAGKTPTVIAIVAALRSAGYSPGVISRGYGRTADSDGAGTIEVTPQTPAGVCGDEPLLIRTRTLAPVVVGARRVDAGKHLLELHPTIDVIVSDDGLQHLALRRTAQVIVFDERGAGNGWLLPAGPLREALPASMPDRTLVLYNATAPSTELPGSLACRRLAGVAELGQWWRGEPATAAALEALRDRPLLAVAGLARPERFFEMLQSAGLSISALPLLDHYDYRDLPWPVSTPDVVVTEKDAVKLDPTKMGSTRVWVAPLDFKLDADFVSALIALLPPSGNRHGNTPP